MADVWALFGDDDASAGTPSSHSKSAPPPRASNHPFFRGTRECWCFDGEEALGASTSQTTLKNGTPSAEYLKQSLNLDGRVPRLVAKLKKRNLIDCVEALKTMEQTPTNENASGVITSAVQALTIHKNDLLTATNLNACILLARAVRADAALGEANEAVARMDNSSLQKAMLAAEAAVLLAECALLVDDPEEEQGVAKQSANRRWIGARVVAASQCCTRVSEKDKNEPSKNTQHVTKKQRGDGSNLLKTLPTTMDTTLTATVRQLHEIATRSGMTVLKRLDRIDCMSNYPAAEFYNEYVSKSKPVVLQNLQRKDQWMLQGLITDLNLVRDIYGDTPVPVERGVANVAYGNMGDEGGMIKQSETSYSLLSTFLDEYFAADETEEKKTGQTTTGTSIGYISQHSLLHQLPSLQHRFTVPQFCFGRVSAVNAWLGTQGTITHLHTDDAENLLCQVAGYKLVHLYPPSVSNFVYSETRGGNGSVNAFSPVLCENVDAAKYPDFEKAMREGIQLILAPGETLFIPRGWWHYVRALTPSFSVNFWF